MILQSTDKLRRLRQNFDRCKLLYDKVTSGVPAEIQRRFLQTPSLGTVCTDCPTTDKFFYIIVPEITILLNIQLRALHMEVLGRRLESFGISVSLIDQVCRYLY